MSKTSANAGAALPGAALLRPIPAFAMLFLLSAGAVIIIASVPEAFPSAQAPLALASGADAQPAAIAAGSGPAMAAQQAPSPGIDRLIALHRAAVGRPYLPAACVAGGGQAQ